MCPLWRGLACGAEVHEIVCQINQLWNLPALVGCHRSTEPGCAGTQTSKLGSYLCSEECPDSSLIIKPEGFKPKYEPWRAV